MKFVEDHRANAVKRGSSCSMRMRMPSVTTSIRVRDPTRLSIAHPIADRLAGALAAQRRHAPRRRARRQAARLEHDDAAAGEPFLVEQRERHARRLAGARRCLQDDAATVAQGRAQRIDHRLDRQIGRYPGGVARSLVHNFINNIYCVDFTMKTGVLETDFLRRLPHSPRRRLWQEIFFRIALRNLLSKPGVPAMLNRNTRRDG